MEMFITIKANPVTKKNSMSLVRNKGRIIPIPSAAYKKYEKEFISQMNNECRLSIDSRINLKCVYYMNTKRRVDLVNLLEATCDILVDTGVLKDDNCSIVVSHDGSRVLYDKENPRVEITITDADDL